MCEVWRSAADEMSLDEIRRAFTGFRDAGFVVAEISGGEPFLRTDLFEILEALDSLGFVYSVNTNGTLLTEETATRLERCSGLLQLAVSLDSLDRERYALLRGADSLPRVLESIDMLRTHGTRIPAKLNVTMSRINRDEVLGILSFARENGLGMSVFPVMQGPGLAHRADDPLFSATAEERAAMAALFRELAALRRAGEPLWEYSGYYEVAADYVLGRPPRGCDAGRVFFDLRADGGLAACVDLPPFASLRERPPKEALDLVTAQADRIRACAESTPCCYTCTANVSETARHPIRFVAESARIRSRRERTSAPGS